MPLKRIAVLFLLACVGAPHLAGATPITWNWSATVSGTAFGLGQLNPITIPVGTPMEFTVTFDSSAPNLCPSYTPTSGNYGFTQATISFLGQQYDAYGGIESNSAFGSCISTGETIFRLFPELSTPFLPGATPIFFPPASFFALGAPDPATPGALPTALPFEPFPTFGVFGPGGPGSPQLAFDSVYITTATVPEPATLTLVTAGVAITLWRRRQHRGVRKFFGH